MWTSPNSDNPWRPFRCLSATHCVSIPDGRDARKGHTLAQNVKQGSTEYERSNERNGFNQTQDAAIARKNLYNFDDNGNANMSYTVLCSGLRNVTTCDKETQTDLDKETPMVRDPVCHVAVEKVGKSKSCESFVRKCTINPQGSRSYEMGKLVDKESVNFMNTIVSENDKSPLKSFIETNDILSPIFQAEKSDTGVSKSQRAMHDFSADKLSDFSPYDSSADIDHGENGKLSRSEFSDGEYYASPVDLLESVAIGTNPDQHFLADAEAAAQDKSSKRRSGGSYKNQWSPFQVDQEGARTRELYDYRQPDEVSLTSERSCYSTTSDEEGDSYEVINWNQYTDDYEQEEMNRQRRSNAYNTAPTTPTLDLSGLDGYHTAPNSPDYLNSQARSDSEVNDSAEFCVINADADYINTNSVPEFDEKNTHRVTDLNVIDKDVTNHNIPNNANTHHYDQNLCCKCGKTGASGVGVQAWTMAKKEQTENGRETSFGHSRRNNNRMRLTDSRVLQLELPPLISVNSLHYEADPETGRAKVIGRGSFGLVYKARFSDPMFYHLPIVIKEFDEEFTNTKEIIDEAKRLLYLQDTGYVPICYGLLCFGSPNEPKYGIVQEYVGTGLTLEQMLWDQYELPLQFWFRIVIQCCEGLARFHDKGILLNDIKTNNILLEFAEHSVRIRYIDFGLATDMRGKRYKNTKSLEDFVYLAPEVRQRGRVTNVASDIYSLGYILEQIKKFTGMHELTVVARLCMDKDPDKRLPVRSAAKLIKDHVYKLGYDPLRALE